MTGFSNVIHGVGHFFDNSYHAALVLLAPEIDALAEAFKKDGGAAVAGVITTVGEAVTEGKSGNDLLLIAEGAVEKAGLKLGAAAIAAIIEAAKKQATA